MKRTGMIGGALLLCVTAVCWAGDSVSWDNLNLIYKPPKPVATDKERQGEFVEKAPTILDIRLSLEDDIQARENLVRNIADLEKGLKSMPQSDDPMAQGIRQDMQTNLETAKGRLAQLDQNIAEKTAALRDAGQTAVQYNGHSDTVQINRQSFTFPLQPGMTFSFLPGFADNVEFSKGGANGQVIDLQAPIDSGFQDQQNYLFLGDRFGWGNPDTFDDQAKNHEFFTGSTYINDRWRINDKWSFNIGFRYEDVAEQGVDPDDLVTGRPDQIQYQAPAIEDFQGRLCYNFSCGMTQIDPPPLSFGNDEGLGEQYGIGGPVIAAVDFGRRDFGYIIYEPNGSLIGWVDKDKIRRNPTLTTKYVEIADQAGQQQLFRQPDQIDFSPLAQCGLSPRPVPDYKPVGVIVPQLGLSMGDAYQYGQILNDTLINARQEDDLIRGAPRCPVTYINEPVLFLEWKEDVVPNDPYYMQGGRKKKVSAAQKAGGLIGSALKFGGRTLGGGAMSVRVNKKDQIKDQWGLREVGYLPVDEEGSAWAGVDFNTPNVIVAVIDSGLDLSHPDAPRFIWTNEDEIPDNGIDDDHNGYVDDTHGWNFLDQNTDMTDYKGHGTLIAGIIAAKTNNGQGIAGINPGAVIMPLKVMDEKGVTNSLAVYRAMRYAVNNGARVINLSIGARGSSQLLQLALNYADAQGVLVFVAAGNENESLMGYAPGGLRRIITVGSLDHEGSRSVISNWGVNLSFLAPGDQIWSLHSKDAEWDGPVLDRDRLYRPVSGTSYSAPIAAATASLLMAKYPELTHNQIEDILVATASDMGEEGWDGKTGAGVLDAAAAMAYRPENIHHVKVTDLIVHRDRRNIESVDVFGTVRGDFTEFVVEIAHGKTPSKWKRVAGPYTMPADNNWICRIDGENFRGARQWHVRLKAVGKDGKAVSAQVALPEAKSKKDKVPVFKRKYL